MGGSVLLDAGAGNDGLRLNRNDPEMRAVRGGHMIARGGPGTISSPSAPTATPTRSTAREQTALRSCAEASAGRRRKTATPRLPAVRDADSQDGHPGRHHPARHRDGARAAAVDARGGDARRQLSGISTTRIGRGVNRMRLKLSASAAARLRGKRTVSLLIAGRATRASGDFEPITRAVKFTTR